MMAALARDRRLIKERWGGGYHTIPPIIKVVYRAFYEVVFRGAGILKLNFASTLDTLRNNNNNRLSRLVAVETVEKYENRSLWQSNQKTRNMFLLTWRCGKAVDKVWNCYGCFLGAI